MDSVPTPPPGLEFSLHRRLVCMQINKHRPTRVITPPATADNVLKVCIITSDFIIGACGRELHNNCPRAASNECTRADAPQRSMCMQTMMLGLGVEPIEAA